MVAAVVERCAGIDVGKPVFNALDDGELEVVLANSQQVKSLRSHEIDLKFRPGGGNS